MQSPDPIQNPQRRTFLKSSAAAVVGGSLAASLGSARMAHASGDDTLKVGLIGCGGRGSGAAVNATQPENRAKLTAMADLFPDRLEESKKRLAAELGSAFAVSDEHCFSGFDAYKQMMATDVDVVLLCTPPHFRPAQLAAAIAAGKHVFCEKPVAVDPTGVREVLATCEEARKKGLSVVSGLCWRYDYGVRATMDAIKSGAIGDIVAVQENYLTGTLWQHPRQDSWSDMEYQLRNWLYYTWLSGDHIVEQHIHSLDKALWLMDDVPPAKCVGLGGRQVRVDEKFGHIYDHFSVCYEWENGGKTFAHTRQMRGTYGNVEDYVLGTKGRAQVLAHEVNGERVHPTRNKPSMYNIEHLEMFQNIRGGTPINNGTYMSYSTLMAIMGREACYTGQEITWDQALNAEQKLGPSVYAFGPGVEAEVAVPGVTQFG